MTEKEERINDEIETLEWRLRSAKKDLAGAIAKMRELTEREDWYICEYVDGYANDIKYHSARVKNIEEKLTLLRWINK